MRRMQEILAMSNLMQRLVNSTLGDPGESKKKEVEVLESDNSSVDSDDDHIDLVGDEVGKSTNFVLTRSYSSSVPTKSSAASASPIVSKKSVPSGAFIQKTEVASDND